MKFFYRFLFILIIALIFIECARKGRPNGGPKDEDAPILVTAKPPYGSINFDKKEIRLDFDEYIVLKDLNKQLIVSPPLKTPALITPQGTPSKYIKIKILDTLQPNTTYTFNFGNAVQDNNENNKIESFKYVFSTGKFIDSLRLRGRVSDALETKLKKNISILLYRLDSTFTDSIPLKRKPNYVTNTLDSLHFEFTNIKKGKYLIAAIDEEVKDYIFNPKTDKFGFYTDTISLPKDTLISNPIAVFKEKQPFKFKRGKEVSKGKIQFGFSGGEKDMKVSLLSSVPSGYKSYTQFEEDKDTLNYWFTPIVSDSLKFIVSKNEFKDTITVRLRKKKIDSLSISSTVSNYLHLQDTLFLKANNPIVNLDKTRFSLIDKDTTVVNFELKRQKNNEIALLFKQNPKDRYKFKILPKGITDVFGVANDTLTYTFATKDPEDYGTISLDVKNETNQPIIIELLSKNEVERKIYLTKSSKIDFKFLELKEYKIRAIIDENDNKEWDTGNYLNKIQPEKIQYFNKEIPLRANWIFNETFIVN